MMHFRTLPLALLGLAACSADVDFELTRQPDAGHVTPVRSTEWVDVFSGYPDSQSELHFGRKVAIAGDNVYATSQADPTTAWRLTQYSKQGGGWLAKVLRAEDVQADPSGPGGLYADQDEVWLGVPGAGMGGEVWQLSPDLTVIQRLPSPVPDAEFGTSVLANSDWLFVGAAGQDRGRGAVHVFRRMGSSGLVPAGVLNPPQGAGFPRLGHALAQDNLHLYVGAPDRCPAGRCGPGAVYVYTLDASGIWQQEDPVWQSPSAGLLGFGHDLAARGGGRVVVTTPFSQDCATDQVDCFRHPGQAYMASGDVSAPAWSDPLRPETPDKHQEYFGWAVDAHGPHVVFGAPGDRSSTPTGQGGDRANAGVVFVMTDGEPYQRLRPVLWNESDKIGTGLAVSQDVLVVAATNKNPPGRTDRSGVITIFELREVLAEN